MTTKHDANKPRWDLLPMGAVAAVVDVLTYGARKYAPDNWRTVDDGRRRYYAAALRHLVAWWLGERRDPESGLPHLAHAACCLLFLAEIEDEINTSESRIMTGSFIGAISELSREPKKGGPYR